MFTIGLLAAFGRCAHGKPPVKASKDTKNATTELRIWGVGGVAQSASPLLIILTKLEADYQREHPEVTFSHHLSGDDSALGGLYVGAADLALMDREPSYIELDGYQQMRTGRKPFELALMRGGARSGDQSAPIIVVVNSSNPLAQLKLSSWIGYSL